MNAMPLPAGLKKRLKRLRVFQKLNEIRHKLYRKLCNMAAKLPCSSLTFGPPKGRHPSTRKFIEGFKSDPANPASFQEGNPGREIVVPAPKVLLGTDKEFFRTPLTYQSEEAFLATIPWGRFYRQPRAFIAPDDRLLVDMSPWWGENPRDHWIFDRMKLAKARTLRGRTLELGETSWFFHFLFDNLPTLDLLERAGRSIAEFDHIILESYGQPFVGTVIDHLRIPREKIVDPRQHPHLLCESLTAISHPGGYDRWRPAFLKRAFADLRATPPVSSRRIYISRKNAPGRRVANDGELEPILRRHGFAILEMEKLSFAEQVTAFRQAEVVAGPAGAAFTHLNFCQPGTRVLSMMCDEDTSAGALMKVWDTTCALNGLEFHLLCAPSPNLHVTVGSASFVADIQPDVKLFEQMIGALVS
jgi:hypothetical protein